MSRTLRIVVLCALAAIVATPRPGLTFENGEPFLVAFSTQLIEIDSSFTGTSIILFGATEVAGDVVVTVRGPERPVVVRRKRRSAGIWLNRDSVAFRDVPQYYAVAASRPLEEIASEDFLNHNRIGVDHLHFDAIWIRTEEETDAFRKALARHKIAEALYPGELGTVEFIDQGLFRATLSFPAGVPTGDYVAEAFLIRGGAVVSTRTTSLRIEKGGFSAELSAFSYTNAALYGVIAIALALVAGWLGSVVFRKT